MIERVEVSTSLFIDMDIMRYDHIMLDGGSGV